MPSDDVKLLSQDIKRTIILGSYMQHWGMPESRIISSKEQDRVEIYSFPQLKSKVARIATVGVSDIKRENKKLAGYELLMVLPRPIVKKEFAQLASFLMDIFIYSLQKKVKFGRGLIIPESPLMPDLWAAKAFLIEAPLGEPEELEFFHIRK